MSRMPLGPLRAEAGNLVRTAPRYRSRIRIASASHIGSVGRARAGVGENFWQYRRYAAEDGAERVDWRRSAREDKLFVRENESETPRTFLLWLDANAGFHWRSRVKHPHKSARALVLLTALGEILLRAGERCGVLGSRRPVALGMSAIGRCAEDMWRTNNDPFPSPPRQEAFFVLASDFYDPTDLWRQRLESLAHKRASGVLLAIADPVENQYPFKGRLRLRLPDGGHQRLFGRAESVRDDYLRRFAANRAALADLAERMGWRLITHATDEAPKPVLAELIAILSQSDGQI